MTQDEVDLIYEYLHENYEYRNGKLIVRNDIRKGHKKGVEIGQFRFSEENSPRIMINIPVHKHSLRLSHAIYIYFEKVKPKNIVFLDGNPTNNAIQNLKSMDSIPRNGFSLRIKKPIGLIRRKESKSGVFTVKIKRDYKQVYFGSYDSKELAQEVYIYDSELWDRNSFSHEEWLKIVRVKYPLKNSNKFIRNIQRNLPMGVMAHGNKFRSVISINSKKKHLGLFDTPEEAHKVYLTAKMEHRG